MLLHRKRFEDVLNWVRAHGLHFTIFHDCTIIGIIASTGENVAAFKSLDEVMKPVMNDRREFLTGTSLINQCASVTSHTGENAETSTLVSLDIDRQQ